MPYTVFAALQHARWAGPVFVVDPEPWRSKIAFSAGLSPAKAAIHPVDAALILLAALMFANNLGVLNETVGTYD